MDNLPFEVISNITSYLEKSSICECMKVCRSWYSRMSPKYYEELECAFFDDKLLKLTEMTRIDGKKIGDFARYIQFSYVYHLQKADFCRLLYNLPYLHTIHFTNADKCVSFLASIPPERLQNIQEVTAYTRDRESEKTIFSINVKLNDRITRMFLSGVDVDIMVSGYNDLFTALSSFTKLTELSIDVQNSKGSCLHHILNCCRHLERLRFNSDGQFAFTQGNHGTHRNLKALRLDALDGILPENLDNIADTIPNLKELAIDHFRHQEVSVFDLNIERFKKFAHYLKTLSKFSFQEWRTYDENKPTYCIQDKRFWSYIQELVSDDYSCSLNIYLSALTSPRNIEITGNTLEKTINITNCWIENNDLAHEQWMHFLKFLNLQSATISLSESSANFGEQQTYLFEPLIQLLKQRKNHRSTFLRVTFLGSTTVTFKFVDPEIFEYKVQKQKQGNYEQQTHSKEVLAVVDDLRPIFGERLLDVTDLPAPYNVEYLIEINDAEKIN